MRPDEAFGIPLESLAEDNRALGDDFVGPAVMEDLWGEQPAAGVMMLGVVPGEEDLAEAAGILDGTETIWELRTILQGFELTLRERVVIGDVRVAVGLGDAQVGEEQGDRLGGHRSAAIGMDGELVRHDVLLAAGLTNQPLGQLGALAFGDHPADDVAAEDVEDHIEIELGPFDRPEQLGNVPTPDLIWRGGQQLGLLIVGVGG